MPVLMKAVASRDEAAIRECLSQDNIKEELDTPDPHGNTPLNYACAMGIKEELILQMISLGASCTIANKNGAMPLNHAVYSRLSPTVLKAIVAAGGDVDYQNESGGTALQVACVCKAGVATVQCLVDDLHATVDLANNTGNTPLMFAIRNKNEMDVCKFLSEHTVNIDAQTSEKDAKYPLYTALHFAAQEGAPAHAAILITNGAKQDLKDGNGMVASDLADEKTKQAMVSSSFAKFQLEHPGLPMSAMPDMPAATPQRRSTFQGEAQAKPTRSGPLRRTSMLATQPIVEPAPKDLSGTEPIIQEDAEL